MRYTTLLLRGVVLGLIGIFNKDVQAKIVSTGDSWHLIQRVPTTKLLGVPCDLPPILQENGLLITFSGRRLVNRDVNFKKGNPIRIDSYTAFR
jgi:hypothetical protein